LFIIREPDQITATGLIRKSRIIASGADCVMNYRMISSLHSKNPATRHTPTSPDDPQHRTGRGKFEIFLKFMLTRTLPYSTLLFLIY
jgi:hypothetical protein